MRSAHRFGQATSCCLRKLCFLLMEPTEVSGNSRLEAQRYNGSLRSRLFGCVCIGCWILSRLVSRYLMANEDAPIAIVAAGVANAPVATSDNSRLQKKI